MELLNSFQKQNWKMKLSPKHDAFASVANFYQEEKITLLVLNQSIY